MKKVPTLLLVFGLAMPFLTSCAHQDDQATIALCGNCGQIKGSDSCCVAGAERCAQCGLVKGSPGCCKMEKGADVALCSHCGQIAGSAACCVDGAARCPKCGMIVGSPGCCKMPASR